MTATLPLYFPSAPVADETAALLDLIAGDPLHAPDRAVIVREMVDVARANGGRVDMNVVRARLVDGNNNMVVYPRVIGAVVSALAQRGVLVADGWTVSDDRRGGNAGKPCRRWKLAGDPR
jgi:hypothetical protein